MNTYPRLAAAFAACPLPVCVLDTESTGGVFAADRLTEIAVYRFENGRMDTFRSLINPQRPIPPFIRKLTGIGDDTVAVAPVFADFAAELQPYLQGCLLVAHNSRFDYTFLQHEFGRCRTPFAAPTLCSVRLSRRLYPQHFKHSLESIIARHGIETDGRHRAEADVAALCAFLEQAVAEHGQTRFLQELSALADPGFVPDHLPTAVRQAVYRLSDGCGLLVFRRRTASEYLVCTRAFREAVAYLRRNGGGDIEAVEFRPAAGLLHALTLLAAERQGQNYAPPDGSGVYCTVRWQETDGGRLQARIRPLADGFYPQPPNGLFLHPKAARRALAEWARRHNYCPAVVGLPPHDGSALCPVAEAGQCGGAGRCGRHRPDAAECLSAAADLPVADWGRHTALTVIETDPYNGLTHTVRCRGGAVEWCGGGWFFDGRIPKAVKHYLKQGGGNLVFEP